MWDFVIGSGVFAAMVTRQRQQHQQQIFIYRRYLYLVDANGNGATPQKSRFTSIHFIQQKLRCSRSRPQFLSYFLALFAVTFVLHEIVSASDSDEWKESLDFLFISRVDRASTACSNATEHGPCYTHITFLLPFAFTFKATNSSNIASSLNL